MVVGARQRYKIIILLPTTYLPTYLPTYLSMSHGGNESRKEEIKNRGSVFRFVEL